MSRKRPVKNLIIYLLPVILGICLLFSGCEKSTEEERLPEAAAESIVEPIPEEGLAAVFKKAEDAVTADHAGQLPEPDIIPEAPDPDPAADSVPVPETEPEPDPQPEAVPEEEPESAPEPPAETAAEEPASAPEETLPPAAVQGGGRLIVIDPGHSANIPSGSEPLGPGSAETKAKDAVGTRGTATGVMEYELVLNVSLLLQNELTARGYTVILTRTSNSDSISCMERAQVANNAGAAAYIRVHADGAESASAHGASVLCVSSSNPYTPSTYVACRRLSEAVIASYCAATGCYNRGVVETDAMSGNNWSRVPTTLIELGFMTNPEEDALMSSADYQARMVKGIADGIDVYMSATGQ